MGASLIVVAQLNATDADEGRVSILAVEESYGRGPFTESISEGETWWEIDARSD